MKPFKMNNITASCNVRGELSLTDSERCSLTIMDGRTAKALTKWLLKATEPAKKPPAPEPRVGSKVTVTTPMDRGMYLNRPGVITDTDYSGTWPYDVDVTMPDGRVESTILARDEFKVLK